MALGLCQPGTSPGAGPSDLGPELGAKTNFSFERIQYCGIYNREQTKDTCTVTPVLSLHCPLSLDQSYLVSIQLSFPVTMVSCPVYLSTDGANT